MGVGRGNSLRVCGYVIEGTGFGGVPVQDLLIPSADIGSWMTLIGLMGFDLNESYQRHGTGKEGCPWGHFRDSVRMRGEGRGEDGGLAGSRRTPPDAPCGMEDKISGHSYLKKEGLLVKVKNGTD